MLRKTLIRLFCLFSVASFAQSVPVMGPIVGQAAVCSAPASAQSLTASASNSPLAYGWSVTPSAGVLITGQGSAVVSISFPATSSVYVVNCVAANASGAAAAPAAFTVTVFETPQVTFSGAGAFFCQGSSTNIQASPTTISASSTISYSWMPATGLSATNVASPFANPGATTTYTINYSIGTCTNTALFTASVVPLPVVNAAFVNPSVCKGQQAQLLISGSAGAYYLNSVPTGLNTTINTSSMNQGVYPYTITGVDANGCADSTTASLTVNPIPNIGLFVTQPTVCAGNTNTLLIIGNALSYSLNGVATGTNVVVSTATPTLSVTGTNAAGCTNTATTFFGVVAAPQVTASLSANIICPSQSATLSIGGTATSYSLNGSATATQAVFVGSLTPTGVNNYVVSGLNASGCSALAPVLTLTVSLCNGLQQWQAGSAIRVYPNPATDGHVTIESVHGGEATLTDALGREVIRISLTPGINQTKLELCHGVYFLTHAGTRTKLIVRE